MVAFCGMLIHAWNEKLFRQILSILARFMKLDDYCAHK